MPLLDVPPVNRPIHIEDPAVFSKVSEFVKARRSTYEQDDHSNLECEPNVRRELTDRIVWQPNSFSLAGCIGIVGSDTPSPCERDQANHTLERMYSGYGYLSTDAARNGTAGLPRVLLDSPNPRKNLYQIWFTSTTHLGKICSTFHIRFDIARAVSCWRA